MASVTTRNGRRAVQFIAADGKRFTLSLGKVPQRAADQFAGFLDRLLAARKAGLPLDGPTAAWLAGLPAATRKRLAAAGLIEAPAERPAVTLGDFLADFVARRVDVKPATKEIWSQVVRNLTEHFGSERPLASITAADADDFKLFLLQQKLAPTTVQKRLQFARTFFTAAQNAA